MDREQPSQLSLSQLREVMDKFGGEWDYTNRREMRAASGETFIMNLLLRCLRRDGKQVSYAKVWLTESDGTTPFKPDTLYLGVTARGSVLTRDIGVSQLEATLIDDIEEGQAGCVVNSTATAYDRNSDPIGEISNSLTDCATP